MSDEEKKAIESFKEENNNDLSRFDDFNSYTQFKVKRDKIIIDLIEKQSKEIEELNYIKRSFDYCVEQENKKWEDKIKAKIGERMQKNNNIIHNAKLKYGKDYYWYDDVQEANRENDIYKDVLNLLLEKE